MIRERSAAKDSWPKDLDVGGDMTTRVSLKLLLPPTETCILLCELDQKFPELFFFSFLRLLSLVVVQSSIFCLSKRAAKTLPVRVS